MPVIAILLQGLVAIVITLSGRYDQILNYVTCNDYIFFGFGRDRADRLSQSRCARSASASAVFPYAGPSGHDADFPRRSRGSIVGDTICEVARTTH